MLTNNWKYIVRKLYIGMWFVLIFYCFDSRYCIRFNRLMYCNTACAYVPYYNISFSIRITFLNNTIAYNHNIIISICIALDSIRIRHIFYKCACACAGLCALKVLNYYDNSRIIIIIIICHTRKRKAKRRQNHKTFNRTCARVNE